VILKSRNSKASKWPYKIFLLHFYKKYKESTQEVLLKLCNFFVQRSNATEEITWKPELHNDETADIMSQDQLINYWNIQDPKLGTNFPIRIFYSRSLSCKSQTYNVTKYESDFRIFQVCTISTKFGKIIEFQKSKIQSYWTNFVLKNTEFWLNFLARNLWFIFKFTLRNQIFFRTMTPLFSKSSQIHFKTFFAYH